MGALFVYSKTDRKGSEVTNGGEEHAGYGAGPRKEDYQS